VGGTARLHWLRWGRALSGGSGAAAASRPQTGGGRLGGQQRGRLVQVRAVVIARGRALGGGRVFQLGAAAASRVSSGAGGSG